MMKKEVRKLVWGGRIFNIKTITQHKEKKIKNRMKQSGEDCLLDIGFEYWLVKCKHHSNDETDMIDIMNSGQNMKIWFECETRLFYVESGCIISDSNRRQFIPNDSVFDKVSYYFQEIAQERIKNEHGFKLITVFNDLASSSPVHVMVDQ